MTRAKGPGRFAEGAPHVRRPARTDPPHTRRLSLNAPTWLRGGALTSRVSPRPSLVCPEPSDVADQLFVPQQGRLARDLRRRPPARLHVLLRAEEVEAGAEVRGGRGVIRGQ
jgi:hypothetical protein